MARWIDDFAVEEVDTPTLLERQPAGGIGGLVPGGSYTLSATHLTDITGNAATAGATFTHLNTTAQMLLLAYQAPSDTQPEAQAAYGLTTLFQGRTWHADLGMYYYRARWYLPEIGEFAERDPRDQETRQGMPDPYQVMNSDQMNLRDPMGRTPVADFDGKIRVRRLYKPVLVKLDPIWASNEWTEGEIKEQLEEARRIFSNQASVFLFWDVIRKDPKTKDEMTQKRVENFLYELADSTNAHSALPVLYFGRIVTLVSEGGTSVVAKGYLKEETNPHRACAVARSFRAITRHQGRMINIGQFVKTPIETTAHELGHAIGGLFDPGDWRMGISRSVPQGDVMNYPPGKTFAGWETKRLREFVTGVVHQ